MLTPYPTQTILTHCSYPGCDRRLQIFEEWAIGLCAFHADPDASPLPSDEPDWNEILEAIDAIAQRNPPSNLVIRPMKRD